MDFVKLGKRFQNYVTDNTLEGIYRFILNDPNMKLVIGRLNDPIKIIKLIYTIYFLKNNKPAENVSNMVDSELYAFSVLVSTNEYSRVECDWCGGDGTITCNQCDGTGSEPCNQCDGEGEDSEGEPCDWCDGEGTETCSDCTGSGDWQCNHCDGDGSWDNEDSINYRVYDYVSIFKNLKDKLLLAKESNAPIGNSFLNEIQKNSIGLDFTDYDDDDKKNSSLKDFDYVTDLLEIMDFGLEYHQGVGITVQYLDHKSDHFSYLDRE